MDGEHVCKSPMTIHFYKCPGHTVCEHYEPKAAERKPMCYYFAHGANYGRDKNICQYRERGVCLYADESEHHTCEHYKPAVAPAATVTITDEQRKRLGGSPIVGSIIPDTPPEDVVAWIKPPSITEQIKLNRVMQRLHEEIMKASIMDTLLYGNPKDRTNKEDIDMSGNAYFCDSCRGTFPRNEVMAVSYTHLTLPTILLV